MQEGYKDPMLPGSLQFTSHDGLLSMYFPLWCCDGLCYCDTDVYTVDQDRSDRQHSEFIQLDQYANQGLGAPTSVDKDDAVFHLVWTYNIKAVDGRKKARCICNGFSWSGLVKILDKV
jgi:hypothetical protein